MAPREAGEDDLGTGPARDGAPSAADVASFLDRFRLLLRAVRVYPPGHSRVRTALSSFRSAVSALGGDVDVAVRSDALLVRGTVASLEAEAAREIHAALSATGVGWVVAESDAGDEAWLSFTSRLHSNQRRVTGGRGVPADLWGDRIPGIEVELLRFERGAFGEGQHSVEGGGGGGAGGAGGGVGASGDLSTVSDDGSADLLALLLRDRMVRVLLRRIRSKVLAVPEDVLPDAEDDLLARLLRFLPFEVRSDPLRGLRVVRESLAKFLEEANEGTADAQAHRLVARLANAAADVFVAPQTPPEPSATPAAPAQPRAPDPLIPRETLDAICREASVATGAPISGGEGEVEPASLLVHGVLDLPSLEEAERRETWRERLVALLRGRPAEGVACLATHLKAPIAEGDEDAADDHEMLLATALEAGLADVVLASGPAALKLVLETFPRHLAAYLAVKGSKAEDVTRALGFDRVVAAADDLLAPGGALHGERAEALLAEKSAATLPFVAVLLQAKDAATRDRGLRALKAMPLPPTVEVLVRAVPVEYLPVFLRRQICRDVFEGTDPARLSKPAVAPTAAYLNAPANRAHVAARTYATAALASFERADAEPVLKALLARRFLVLPVESRAIRRQAKIAIRGIGEHERQRFIGGKR